MKTTRSGCLVLPFACALLACGSGKSNPVPTAYATGGMPSLASGGVGESDAGPIDSGGQTGELGGATIRQSGGTNSTMSLTSSLQAGMGGTLVQGGATSTGGMAATGGSSFSSGLASLCSPKAKSGQSQALPGLTWDAASRFSAITPDETTLVWTTPTATGFTLSVIDRESGTGNWSSPKTITDIPTADGQVALAPDGLTLAYVDVATRRRLATMRRPDRNSTFQFDDPTSGLDFIVQNDVSRLAADQYYAYPVYGPHSTSFYYAVGAPTGGYQWYVAGRFETEGVFSQGSPIAFAHAPGATLALSGVAWDENTLFFADINTGETSWTFYDEFTLQFGDLSTLGALGFVQPNQACGRLYGGLIGSISATPLL